MESNGDESHNDDSPLLVSAKNKDPITDSTLTRDDREQQPSESPGPAQKTTNRGRNQIQPEVEIGTNPTHDATDHGKNQMMFVVLISIMLVLVSVTFAQSLSPFMIQKYDNPNPTSEDILIVYMLVGLLIIVAMFLRKDLVTEGHHGGNRNAARNNIKCILRNYLSIVGMSFFFPFACILDLSHIIAAIGCDETWRLCGDERYREYLVDLFYHLIRILFMGAELAFCCKFHGSRFKENGLVRCGLMIVMAANLGLWFLSLVYEAVERDGHLEDEGKKCANESDHRPNRKLPENWQTCVHETSSAHEVMHAMIRYLYPFAIEFSLLVGEFLATKFVSHQAIGNTEDDDQPVQPVDIQSPNERNQDNATTPPGTVDPPVDSSGQLFFMFIIAIGLLASFLYISFAFIDSFAHSRNTTEIDSLDWGKVNETYSMINYMLINVLIVAGYICGYGLEIQQKKLHGLDWLVLISAFVPFIRQLIVVIAIAASYTDLSPADFPAILICSRLADWVQLILQSPFIFLSERWRLTERQRHLPSYQRREKILKAIIFSLAVTNLVNWISDSIILADSFSMRNELMVTIFEVDNWQIVEHISLPLLIFYRFNSFLLFTRAYIGD